MRLGQVLILGDDEHSSGEELFRLISIMGDAERIDRAALAKIGPIEEVPLERLFGY